tara:strand:- start:1222 stop:2166 length:945 start_codon:yes stop_codon:yes gene_type:complete
MIDIPELKNTVKISSEGYIENFSPQDAERVMDSIISRSLRYPTTHKSITDKKQEATELREKGWLKLEGALNNKIDLIDTISERLNNILDGGKIEFDSELGRQVGEQGCNILNQSEARNNQLFLSVPEPLYNVPEISDIIFDKTLVGVAKSFFECTPAIGTLNLRKSFVNDLNADGTTLYHVDPNSPYFFKAFVYLKDVDNVEDGPFTYVEGSVDNKPDNLLEKYRWQDNEIENFYGKNKIKHLTAKKGDVVFAMTTGFHKGQKCVSKDRELLTIDYVCHPDSWDIKKSMLIKRDTFLNLQKEDIPLTDFLKIRV